MDYMAEHLNAGGRAGIIVPEGIIFQSQKAQKQLRKKLVEECLVAVVSLPRGVFNPYSGVKTSILLLDKVLARNTDRIAFFKVENDGYDLGAQRHPIEGNELPQVRDEIVAYLQRLRAGEARRDIQSEPTALAAESMAEYVTEGSRTIDGLIVEKERVAGDGEYNLSGERYRIVLVSSSSWPFVPVEEVFERSVETVLPKTLSGAINYVGLENISQNTGRLVGKTVNCDPVSIKSLKNSFRPNQILYGKLRPNLNKVWLSDRNGICSTDIYVITPKVDKVEPTLYSHIFRDRRFNDQVMSQVKGAQLPRIGWKSFAGIEIPLPPLEVQQEIVAEIEVYQKVIDGARAVVENYRPYFHVDPDWPMARVEDVCVINPKKTEISAVNGETIVSFVPMSDMGENTMYFETKDCRELKNVGTSYTYFGENDVLIAKVTPCFENGKAGIAKGLRNGIGFGSSEYFVLRSTGNVLPTWIFLCVATPAFRKWAIPQMTGTGGLQRIPKSVLESYRIPVPDLNTQREIVSELEAEQAAVDANRQLIKNFEKKIQSLIARIWNG